MRCHEDVQCGCVLAQAQLLCCVGLWKDAVLVAAVLVAERWCSCVCACQTDLKQNVPDTFELSGLKRLLLVRHF